MKKRGFLNLCFVATLATVTAGSLYSCKDYDDEIYAELQDKTSADSPLGQQIEEQKGALGDLDKTVKEEKQKTEDLRTDLNKAIEENAGNTEKVEQLNKDLETVNQRIEDLSKVETQLELLQNKLNGLQTELDDKASKEEVDQAIQAALEAYVNLPSELENIKNSLEKFVTKEEFDKVTKNLQEQIDQLAKSDVLVALEGRVKAAEEKLAKLDPDKINGYEQQIQNVDSLSKANKQALDDLRNNEIKALSDKYTSLDSLLNKKVSELQADIKAVEQKLQDQITDLAGRVSSLESDMKKIGILEEKLNQMITSVLLNGAKSPVVGYFALPTGLKSNILAAYYGQAETNEPMGYFEFPSPELQSLVGNAKDNSTKEFENGKTILAEGFNAGKVYLTVNPSSVDMANKTFSLINSKGDAAPLVFDTARLSEDKLTFGYSRAGQNKNFYEVKARLNEDQIANAKLRMEISEMKEALGMVKDAVLNDASLDVTQLASAIFKCVNDIADANAVKVSWETTDVDNKKVQHDVTSDYGLAAVAIKPLSYDFMKDYEITNFWGIDKAYNLLDKIIASAKEETARIPGMLPTVNMENLPKIDTIKIDPLSEEILAQFVLTIDTVIKTPVEIDTTMVAKDVKVPLDSVKVPDMSTAIEGQIITVPIEFTKEIEVTVPADTVKVKNYAKRMPGEAGYEPNIHDEMPEFILVPIAATTVKDVITVKEEKKVKVDGKTVKVEGPWVKLDDVVVDVKVPVNIKKDIEVPFKYTVDMTKAVQDLYGNVTGSIEDVNKMLKDLKKFIEVDLQQLLDQINGMGTQIQGNVNDLIDKVNGKLNSLIGKVNNVLCKVVNNVNEALQPVMFAQAGDFVMVSRAENAPSVYAGDKFVLVPSSYSAEFLAPAAQKFIAVTNVIKGDQSAQAGNGDCQTAMKNVNSKNADLCRVLAGDNHAVGVEHLEKGFTYEFTYSAVDYYGKVRNTKCYVAVK